ncbi:hypothetical protein DVA81_18660, partial [Acinetobacter baumannii]
MQAFSLVIQIVYKKGTTTVKCLPTDLPNSKNVSLLCPAFILKIDQFNHRFLGVSSFNHTLVHIKGSAFFKWGMFWKA